MHDRKHHVFVALNPRKGGLTMTTRPVVLATGALLVAVLVGCSPASDAPGSTAFPEASPEASPSPLVTTVDPAVPLEEQALTAIQGGNGALLRALLDAGLDPEAELSGGTSPLSLAAMANNVEAVDILVEAGADIDAIDSAGETALMRAARFSDAPVIEAILDAGADPYIHPEVFPGYAAHHIAGQQGNVAALTVFVERGINLDFRSVSMSTALIMAVYGNHPEAVEYLLSSGAPMDINARDDVDTTALGWARYKQADDIVAMLTEAGATE